MTQTTAILALHYTSLADCVFVDKCSGFNTHAADLGRTGMVELMEYELGEKLFVVHRLDKGTSGALCFAKSAETAKALGELFEKHKVKKRYLFLTSEKIDRDSFDAKSLIEKDQGAFVSHPDKEPNAFTSFRKLKSLNHGDLWEAIPLSGKPHQIRLHAQDAGIPILGDDAHGGDVFSRLCLHSVSLKFTLKGEEVSYETVEPFWTEEFSSREDFILREAAESRRRLYGPVSLQTCLRLSHHEIDSYRMDQFGSQLWLYWYKEGDPNEMDLWRFERFAKDRGQKMLIRKMLNRGEESGPSPLWKLNEAQERWTAQENGVSYQLRTDSGLSPGLFLDQRENRLWVRKKSKEKRVLNLFSYTGGFSVNAALGGAKEVASVDVSSNFLDWSKENFKLNGLDPEKYEFWTSDSVVFLKGCFKRKRKFDIILCDPPSFGRSKTGVFSISKNYEELLIQCMYCLEKGGLLLFSTNYEKWTLADLKKNLVRLKSQFSFQIQDAPHQGLDFEKPDEERLMKSVILRKG